MSVKPVIYCANVSESDMKDGNFIVRENNQSRKVTYTHDVEQ